MDAEWKPGGQRAGTEGSEGSPASSLSEDMRQSLRDKDTEIRHLRGKIRGYETLGELYRETKQKCNLYRITYDEMLRRLTDLHRAASGGTGEQQERLDSFLQELGTFLDDPQKSVLMSAGGQESEGSMSLGGHPVRKMTDSTTDAATEEEPAAQPPPTSSLVSHTEPASPTSMAGQTEPASPSSLLCGVRTTPLEAGSDRSLGSSEGGYVNVEHTTGSSFTVVSPSDTQSPPHTAGPASSLHSKMKASISEQLRQLCDSCQGLLEENTTLRSFNSDLGTTSMTDIIQELMRLTMEVMKKERMMNVFVENIVEDREKLKEELSSNDAKMRKMRVDFSAVLEELNQCRSKLREHNLHVGGAAEGQWAEVGQRVGREQSAELAELEKKVKSTEESYTKELEKANAMWGTHFADTERRHKEALASMEQELLASRLEAEEEQQQLRRQIEQLTEQLEAQRLRLQLEQGEVQQAAEELRSLHCTEPHWEPPCDSAITALKLEVLELRKMVTALQPPPPHSAQEVSLNSAPLPAGERELVREVQALRQQVAIYQEDFVKERRDHEKAQSLLRSERAESARCREELSKARDELTKVKRELKAANQSKVKLTSSLSQREEQIQSLRATVTTLRQMGPVYMSASPAWPSSPVWTSQEQLAPKPQEWACQTCTYNNSADRKICEVCGARAPSSQLSSSPLLVHRGGGVDQCDELEALTIGSQDDLVIDKSGTQPAPQ